MYHEIGIHRLSPTQISKLLNGHRVRVKHGSGHKIHVSQEQHKKIMAAHHKGKAHTLQLDPYQIAQHQHLRHGSHGEGILNPAIYPAIYNPVGRTQKKPISMNEIYEDLSKPPHLRYVDIHPSHPSYGIRPRGRPRKHAVHHASHAHHASHGEGPFEDFFTQTLPSVGRQIAPHIVDVAKSIGHEAGKTFGPVNPFDLGYKLGNQVIGPAIMGHGHIKKHTPGGYGEGRRRAGRRGHGLAGGALLPAGYGEGEGIRRRGRPKGKGEGVKRRGRKGKGEGIFGSTLGSLAGSFLPF